MKKVPTKIIFHARVPDSVDVEDVIVEELLDLIESTLRIHDITVQSLEIVPKEDKKPWMSPSPSKSS